MRGRLSRGCTTRRLHKFITTPSNSGQGVGLSRRAWTRLNRLRTGVGRFGANMLRWRLSTNDSSVTVVLNKRQTTSPVDAAPSTDHLRGSMASLFWTMRREHGSRTMLWTYEWCVMAHARRRRMDASTTRLLQKWSQDTPINNLVMHTGPQIASGEKSFYPAQFGERPLQEHFATEHILRNAYCLNTRLLKFHLVKTS